MNIRSKLSGIKHNYLKYNTLNKIRRKFGKKISDHDLFKNNENILKCFEKRICATPQIDIIKRIIKSYNEAKEVQKGLPMKYQVGNEWVPIYDLYMKDIIKTLKSKDEISAKVIYENFMREDCSIGLHGLPCNMKESYFGEKISDIDKNVYLYDTVYRHIHWKELTDNKYLVSDLVMPDYGNPYGHNNNGEFIRTGAEYLHYYSTLISELVSNDNDKKNIVELGGGYGGLGYFLNKNLPNLTYIDFDLPENMALTAYFLLSSFPEKKILLYGEEDFTDKSIECYDIIIMPNFELEKLPESKINLVFNSYSLAEMSTETINTYIPALMKACKNYILHVNHTKVSSSLKADEFGISPEQFQLLSKKPALWNMGRNVNMDEFEYLYKKHNV